MISEGHDWYPLQMLQHDEAQLSPRAFARKRVLDISPSNALEMASPWVSPVAVVLYPAPGNVAPAPGQLTTPLHKLPANATLATRVEIILFICIVEVMVFALPVFKMGQEVRADQSAP